MKIEQSIKETLNLDPESEVYIESNDLNKHKCNSVQKNFDTLIELGVLSYICNSWVIKREAGRYTVINHCPLCGDKLDGAKESHENEIKIELVCFKCLRPLGDDTEKNFVRSQLVGVKENKIVPKIDIALLCESCYNI